MKYIEKLPAPKAWLDFVAGLSENEQKEWNSLTAEARGVLKHSLLTEQGHICCYCGQRIFFDQNLRLEHLAPREKSPEKTFEYGNLLASCAGGQHDKVHLIQKGETMYSICDVNGISLETFLENNPGLPNPYELSHGQKVLINQGGKEFHCDKKKSAEEIPIYPLMTSCESYFEYDTLTGKMSAANELGTASRTIKTLGLNAEILKRERQRLIQQFWSEIEVRELSIHEVQQLITTYYQPTSDGKLQPFCQVLVALLEEELTYRRKIGETD